MAAAEDQLVDSDLFFCVMFLAQVSASRAVTMLRLKPLPEVLRDNWANVGRRAKRPTAQSHKIISGIAKGAGNQG